MKLLSITCLAFAMVAATACGSGQRERQASFATPAPSATSIVTTDTPASPPQLPIPTPTPPPVITSTGWLVHKRGNGVYASALDGSGERKLDAGSVAPGLAQYAGAALLGDGLAVYLLAPVLRVDVPAGGPLYDVAIFRTSVPTGASEELFQYGPMALGDGVPQHVSVSPDGTRIAYGASDGVHVARFGATVDDFLITTGCAGERCPQYYQPLWSPDGTSLLITKQLYEGSHVVLVRGDGPDSVVELSDISGDWKAWAPDGMRFCADAEIYIPAGAWGIDAQTLEKHRIDDISPPVEVGGTRCVWGGSDLVATQFTDVDGERRVRVVEFVGHGSATYELALRDPYASIEGWLPSGDGLIVSGYAVCVPCGERDPATAVLLPDGSLRSLPFAAGVVLAVIP